MFETFDHTADLGLRVQAATLPELFADAGLGLMAMLVEELDSIEPKEHRQLHVAGVEREYLLFDWLNKLLFAFDAEHWLFRRFEICIDSSGLQAEAWGEQVDWDRHQPSHEVKAITYHELKVEPTPDGWLAEVIVDI